jgi:hypothetical protein
MGLYDRYLLSPAIDRMCGSPEVMAVREEIVPEAEGDVLELGMGSGLNLPLYDPARVRRVVGVDPGRAHHRARAAAHGGCAASPWSCCSSPASRCPRRITASTRWS